MSRRSRHWRKLLKQCGGKAEALEATMPTTVVLGAGRYLDKGHPGSTVTRPMAQANRRHALRAATR